MSKKSKQTNAVRRPVQASARTNSKPAGKPIAGKPVSSKTPASAKGRMHIKEEPAVNLMAVRIVSAVIGVLCLAGGIVAAVMQKGVFSAATIIELVLLVLIVAASAYSAWKPEQVTGWVSRLGK
jgi:hypothetical protein